MTQGLPKIEWPVASDSEHKDLYRLAQELFPICRSLTGEGVRTTLRLLQGFVPGLKTSEIPTGTQCFDWKIPDEWNIRGAYLAGSDGKRIVDFRDNNLH